MSLEKHGEAYPHGLLSHCSLNLGGAGMWQREAALGGPRQDLLGLSPRHGEVLKEPFWALDPDAFVLGWMALHPTVPGL